MDIYANLKSGMTAEKSSEAKSLDPMFEETLASVAESVTKGAPVALNDNLSLTSGSKKRGSYSTSQANRGSNNAKRVALGDAVLPDGMQTDVLSPEPAELSNAKADDVDITTVCWIELYKERNGHDVILMEWRSPGSETLFLSFAA